MAQNLLKSP